MEKPTKTYCQFCGKERSSSDLMNNDCSSCGYATGGWDQGIGYHRNGKTKMPAYDTKTGKEREPPKRRPDHYIISYHLKGSEEEKIEKFITLTESRDFLRKNNIANFVIFTDKEYENRYKSLEALEIHAHQGELFYIELNVILGGVDIGPRDFLIDTGASFSSLKVPKDFREGIKFKGKRKVGNANGITDEADTAEMFVVIEYFGYSALATVKESGENLLGLDILKNLHITLYDGQLILTPDPLLCHRLPDTKANIAGEIIAQGATQASAST